jgi:hypothetical protein
MLFAFYRVPVFGKLAMPVAVIWALSSKGFKAVKSGGKSCVVKIKHLRQHTRLGI